MDQIVDIDGSTLEGGGQILRVAIALSSIKKIPIRIYNIRAGRPKPGLMEQHLKGVQLVRDLCNASVKGAELYSTELTFNPGQIRGGSFNSFVNTAGNITLLLQVALPCALFAPSEVILRLKGGTNCLMAPQVDYMTEVFRPILEKLGATFDFDLIRRGYFPRGGGEVVVTINPIEELTPIQLINRGNITSITGWSFVAGSLPLHLSNLMADGARKSLSGICSNISIECYKEDRKIASDNASGIILVACTDTDCILGGDALGRRQENAELTGKNAAGKLIKCIEQQACVDEYIQDQIIIFMALAPGPSRIKVGEISLHTKTAIYVTEKLTNITFNIETLEDGGHIIHCPGC